MALDPRDQILAGSERVDKTFSFNTQDPTEPAQWWFQNTEEGLGLFVVFYTLACRWNRCLGCNLPSKSSLERVHFKDLIEQVDKVFAIPEIREKLGDIEKVILSNNGSMLDEITFPSTALFHLMVQLNCLLPKMNSVCLETRPEYVDWDELALIDRLLKERESDCHMELAIGFEAFDEKIRNEVFVKGLSLPIFEKLLDRMKPYGYGLKCYFMQKPVPSMSEEEAIEDIKAAIDYLSSSSQKYGVPINMHLNPTYAATGTPLATSFQKGEFTPPLLQSVAKAVASAKGKGLSIFVGLFDEGLAVPGGSFIRPGDESLVALLDEFNKTQNFDLLDEYA